MGDITQWFSGGTPSKDNPLFWNGDIPWISASSMRGLFYSDSELKITKEGLKRGSKLASKGTLLILVRGSMLFNKIPIGIASKSVAFNQDVKSIEVDSQSTSEYILNWFLASEAKILNMVTGTGIGAGKLDLEDLKALEIKIPSIPEQQKIVSFLSVVNERIETQNKIIGQLETLIKGLYLKIFQYNCNLQLSSVSLESLCSIKKGEQINASKLSDSGPYYVMNGGVLPSGYHSEYNSDAETISISEGGNSCGYIQYNYRKFWSGGHCYTLNNIDNAFTNRYLYHYLKANENKIMALRVGSGLPNIQKSTLERFEVKIPNLSEQKKIALAFDNLSNKKSIERKLLKMYQQQKKYLLRSLFI